MIKLNPNEKYALITKNRKYTSYDFQKYKICINCKKEKKCLYFYKKPALKDGFDKKCKDCRYLLTSEYEKSPRCKMSRSEYYYYKTYKLNINDVDKLKQKYNYKCAICLSSENELKRKLHIDHCHKTGKIRGVLCDNCNKSLGSMKDSITILQNAIKYLKDNGTKDYAKNPIENT